MKEIKEGYIRVTEVLSSISGLKDVPTHILENAARRGTFVHLQCDAIIKNIGVNKSHPEWDGYVESFKKWMPKNLIAAPDRFYCDELKITGECDAIYTDGDDLVLVDFKTSAKESETWKLQGSAYAYLARKAGHNISRIEFIHLAKDGSPPVIYRYEEDFETFLKLLIKYIFERLGSIFLDQMKRGPG